MALAQRLNELAIANSDGLLNDDEYRLLRQNLFEQYSTNNIIPSEPPLVPITRANSQLRGGSSNSNSRRPTPKPVSDQHVQPKSAPPNTPVRAKHTVSSTVVNLLRRATGRRTPNPDTSNDLSTTSTTKDPRGKATGANAYTNNISRSNSSSRPSTANSSRTMPHRKPADLAPLHTEVRLHPHANAPTFGSPASPAMQSISKRSIPSPSASSTTTKFSIPPLPSSPPPLSPAYAEKFISVASPIRDVFDESSLFSSSAADIRAAIAVTEDESRKLADAFADLERNTLRRIQKQRARRLPMTTPRNVSVLLEGREWREHRLVPSPSSPLFDTNPRTRYPVDARHSGSSSAAGDGTSIRSGSSQHASFSGSQSVSSLSKNAAPPSPLTPSPSFLSRMPSISAKARLARKGSMSSVSSQTPSFQSSGTGMLGPPPLTRSASYLGLRRLRGNASSETVGLGPSSPGGVRRSRNGSTLRLHAEEAEDEDDVYGEEAEDVGGEGAVDDDAELRDIRRRRDDLVARYTARLEFLRAKLRGAEIHEKLLRK